MHIKIGSRPVTNLNRSMSGKFVARVIATNNTPPSTTSSASTQTTNQVPSNCLYHRVESPSPRAAARVHSNLPQSSYPNYHNHNQRAMAHNTDYITSSAVPIQTTNSAALNELNSSGGGAGNSTLATATVLPVYYEKDSVLTSSAQLPVLKIPLSSACASSTLISNSANSGVGSATAVITVSNPHSAAAAHNAASLSSHPTMSSSSFFGHKNNNISNANLKSTLQQPASALTNNSVPIANRFNRGSSSNSSTTSYQRSNGAAGVTFYSDDINTNNNKISNKSYSVIKGNLLLGLLIEKFLKNSFEKCHLSKI